MDGLSQWLFKWPEKLKAKWAKSGIGKDGVRWPSSWARGLQLARCTRLHSVSLKARCNKDFLTELVPRNRAFVRDVHNARVISIREREEHFCEVGSEGWITDLVIDEGQRRVL